MNNPTPVEDIMLIASATSQYHEDPEIAIRMFKKEFDELGPYIVAKKLCLLFDNSGEYLATVFMRFWNKNYNNEY